MNKGESLPPFQPGAFLPPKDPLLSGADFSLLPEKGPLVVGFSAGADSMALAHALRGAVQQDRIILAHVNHGLRGEESERDEAAARAFARKEGLRFALFRADVKELAKQRGMGLEECGREVRYRFFYSLLQREGPAGAVLTAHNADDNAETILMNLLRGASLTGLCGIPQKRGAVIRPLLRVSREEIEAYCRFHELSFVTDSSNLSGSFRRNRLRLQVMPFFKEENPGFLKAVGRAAESLSLIEDHLCKEAKKLLKEAEERDGLQVKVLRKAHPALQSFALKSWLEGKGCRSLEEKHLTGLLEILEHAGRFQLPGGFLAECFQGLLFVSGEEAAVEFEEPVFKRKTSLPSGKILILEKKRAPTACGERKFHNLLFKNAFDCDTITAALFVRGRREGDRFLPPGREGSRSLKQLFQEEKIPAARRKNAVLLTCGGGIVYCEGLGVSRQFQVTEKTREMVSVQVIDPREKGNGDKGDGKNGAGKANA